MFMLGCFKMCLGTTKEEEKQICLSLNYIHKLIINNSSEKLPSPHDKWKLMAFFDKMNSVSNTVMGGTIEFGVINPNELSDKINNSVIYIVNMFNTKTRHVFHKMILTFIFNPKEDETVLSIETSQNDMITTSHWNFIESVFYNMGYRTKKMYMQKT